MSAEVNALRQNVWQLESKLNKTRDELEALRSSVNELVNDKHELGKSLAEVADFLDTEED